MAEEPRRPTAEIIPFPVKLLRAARQPDEVARRLSGIGVWDSVVDVDGASYHEAAIREAAEQEGARVH